MPPQDRTDMAHSCTMSQTFLYKVFLSPAWLTQVSRPDFFLRCRRWSCHSKPR